MSATPTKDLAEKLGITRRAARHVKSQGRATPQALSDRERYEKARADKTEAEAEAAKLEAAQVRGDLVSKKENADSLREIIEQVKATILFELGESLAIQNEGLSAEKQIQNNRAAIERAFRELQNWSRERLAEAEK